MHLLVKDWVSCLDISEIRVNSFFLSLLCSSSVIISDAGYFRQQNQISFGPLGLFQSGIIGSGVKLDWILIAGRDQKMQKQIQKQKSNEIVFLWLCRLGERAEGRTEVPLGIVGRLDAQNGEEIRSASGQWQLKRGMIILVMHRMLMYKMSHCVDHDCAMNMLYTML